VNSANIIRKRFLENIDSEYKKFSETTIVPKCYAVAGIRMPVIRQFAKEICKGDWRSYLDAVRDEYSEDMILRGMIIAEAKMDLDERFAKINEFVPKIDNWGICDSFCSSLKITKKNKDAVWNMIMPFIGTGEEFQIRFAVVMMLAYFMDEEYVDMVIEHMEKIRHPGYYVKMAVAWCLSYCFINFPEKTMTYLKDNTLDDFTFGKALSKITDSFRVGENLKDEIRKMRRK